MEDIEVFAEDLPEIIREKYAELVPEEKRLSTLLDGRMYVRRQRLLREMKGESREKIENTWYAVYRLNDGPLKMRLASIRSELDRIRQAEIMLNAYLSKDEQLDIEVIKAIPILDFYEYPYKENGGKLIGKCPFHNEKTGSFVIYKKSNSFYCFGCGKGGSVIDYYMHLNGVNSKEAIHSLAKYDYGRSSVGTK